MNMTNDESNRLMELIESLKMEENKLKEFYENKQNEVMVKIYKYLSENGAIDEDDILYFPEEYPFTYDEFYLLTTNIRKSIPEDEWIEDHEISFPNEQASFQYDDDVIELFYMYGQGTAVILRLGNKGNLNCIRKYEDLTPSNLL